MQWILEWTKQPILYSLQGVIEFDTNGDRQNTLVQIEQLRFTDQGKRKGMKGQKW